MAHVCNATSVRLNAPLGPMTRVRVNNAARVVLKRGAVRVALSSEDTSAGFSTRPNTIRKVRVGIGFNSWF